MKTPALTDRAFEGTLAPAHASALPAERRVLVFAPHPDDEVFGCGGTLHLLADAGATITVIVVSDGSLGGTAGDGGSGTLVAAREAESRAAAVVLGYPAPSFWRLPDRGLRYGDALVARMLEAVQALQAELVFAPALSEVHPDHQVVALAAAEALRQLGGDRRIAFYEVGAPLLANTLIDITRAEERKHAAMRCFGSQQTDRPYDECVAALNRYRSYVLSPGARAAEAFLVATVAELSHGMAPLFESALGRRRRLGFAVEGAEVPLVSVIVRSLDRPTLAEALASLAAQTYPNIEVLVVNAKGGRHGPLMDARGRLTMRLIEGPGPLSRSRAANAGLDAARGEYVGFLDDDDELDPDHLSQLVSKLQEQGKGVVAYAGVRCTDRNDPERKISQVFGEPFECNAKLLAGNFIPIHGPLFPRRLLEGGARFDEELQLYEDWDFWLQIAQVARFVYLGRVTATYYAGGTSNISPHAFDTETVRLAALALFDKWKDRLDAGELKSLCDLYLRRNADWQASQAEIRRLADAARDRDAHVAEAQARLQDAQERLEHTEGRLQADAGRLRAELQCKQAEVEACARRLADSEAQSQADVERLRSELRRKQSELDTWVRRWAELEATVAKVFGSRSWRLTHPLRLAAGIARRAARFAARSVRDY